MENKHKYESGGCFLYGFVFVVASFMGCLAVPSVPALGVIIGIIACAITVGIEKNKKTEFEEKVGKNEKAERSILEETDITKSLVYKYENIDSINDVVKNIMYIVDEPQECVFIVQNEGLTKIPFSEILDCKIYEDSEVAGGIGRAIVGGALAGEAGAIVGATTAKKHVSSYKISIIRSNISHPQTSLILIDKQISTQSNNFKSALEFAQNVYASLCAIIANNKK